MLSSFTKNQAAAFSEAFKFFDVLSEEASIYKAPGALLHTEYPPAGVVTTHAFATVHGPSQEPSLYFPTCQFLVTRCEGLPTCHVFYPGKCVFVQ